MVDCSVLAEQRKLPGQAHLRAEAVVSDSNSEGRSARVLAYFL